MKDHEHYAALMQIQDRIKEESFKSKVTTNETRNFNLVYHIGT